MPVPMSPPDLTPVAVAIARALVETMVHPAAIMQDASIVVAANPEWHALRLFDGEVGAPAKTSGASAPVDGARQLQQRMLGGTVGVGSMPIVLTCDQDGGEHAFTARWRAIGLIEDSPSHLTLVVLEDDEEARRLAATIRRQSARIDHLLVRQTLIEEAERRRLGRALHDHASQALAEARRRLADLSSAPPAVTESIALLDGAIDSIRDLAFDLSPPVLEDLGLLPALRWLADDLKRRHRVRMEFIDDGVEPRLAADVRTIAFRAVRELTLNSVKHAPGAEIVVSSRVNDRICRLTVRDTGRGFDHAGMRGSSDARPMYGLLSVEQQILALGGSFELASTPDDGTRAVLTLPLAPWVPSSLDGEPGPDGSGHA